MIGKFKGKIELDIAGEKRQFQFGAGQMAFFLELEKCSLSEAVQRLSNPTDNIKSMINFYYSAAHYSASVRKEEDPNVKIPTYYTVADWIDNLMESQRDELNEVAFAKFNEKEIPNQTAPEETKGHS